LLSLDLFDLSCWPLRFRVYYSWHGTC